MKIRFLLVIGAFLICLVLIVIIRQYTEGKSKIHHLDFYEEQTDWANFTFSNTHFNSDGTNILLDDPSIPGIIESPAIKTSFDFDEILLSWNLQSDGSGGLYVIFSLSPDSIKWYDYGYQIWGGINPDSVGFSEYPHSHKGVGWLDEDIIRLRMHMQYYKFKLGVYADTTGFTMLDRISVCYTKTDAGLLEAKRFAAPVKPIEPFELAVPFKAQGWLPDSISGLTCSPTSLTMAMNYHGFDYTHLQVSGMVYDPYNDIYGNWPYNAQAAYQISGYKYKTWIGRHGSFGELVDELKSGKPIVMSIAVKDGQVLTGAPYKRSEGHLIVIRGFDENGNVLVNDPAGDNLDEGMVTYDINELTDVWQNHNAVVYHIWPE